MSRASAISPGLLHRQMHTTSLVYDGIVGALETQVAALQMQLDQKDAQLDEKAKEIAALKAKTSTNGVAHAE